MLEELEPVIPRMMTGSQYTGREPKKQRNAQHVPSVILERQHPAALGILFRHFRQPRLQPSA